MKKNYIVKEVFKKSTILKFSRSIITIFLLIGIGSMGYAQKKNGRYGKSKKNKNISISSCIQDMGNGMYRVNFSYNNPNDKVIRVPRFNSRVVIKKKAKWGRRRVVSRGINRFQPGLVENAFFVEFYDKEYVRWTLKNPKGKLKRTTANSNSVMCPEPPVIIPVYGQEGGKSETPLGLELTSLAEGNAGDEPSEIVYQITGTGDTREVLLEIVPKPGLEIQVRNLLETTFGRLYLPNDPLNTDFVVDPQMVIDGNLATFDVFFPISRLLELNDYPEINFIRPLYTPVRQEGLTTSQGDGAMFTDVVRESFVLERDEDGSPITFVTGEGITIGVISDSYKKQPFTEDPDLGQVSKDIIDVKNRDLPGDLDTEGNVLIDAEGNVQNGVNVLKDYPYGIASDEGRAMLQLIHDVAPGADLAFSTGILSPRDFALAIGDLAAEGSDIIVDDITYPFEPFFGEGQISEAIREFTSGEGSEGHAYFTSAGNFANRAYQSVFNPSSTPPVTNIPVLETASAHVFGSIDAPEDIFQSISVVPGTYMIVLQWAEPLASQNNDEGATTDLDIFLVDDDGNLIVGNNRVNTNGDAAEVLVFQATGTGTANILITSPSNPGPVPIRYIAFRTTSDAGTNGLQFTQYNAGAPTVSGHAMTPEAITVGAVDYRVAQNPSPPTQAFSSFAGTLTDTEATTLQIDFAAPDGGNTTVLSIGNDITADEDSFPNFFGTSAAAPHAAAAFALLQSAIPSWYPEGGLPVEVDISTNLLADQLLQLFKSTAVPAGSLVTAGSGLINAEVALQQIAAQTSVITGFMIVEGEEEPTPGVDTYDVAISGQYIPADATVFLGDQQLVIVGDITDTQITATVGPFAGNPELTVVTNSELPGAGKSNGLPILPDGKIVLNIIAENIDIEFGASPQFTYMVQGLPGYEEVVFGLPDGEILNAALADLGLQLLPEIVLISTSTGLYPDVNFYAIAPSFGEVELTQEQLEAYQINLINGTLTINKRNLTISPEEVSIVYGEAVNVLLNYDYDTNGIEDNNDFLQRINTSHAQDFFEENTLILINKFRGIVNEGEILNLLNNGSWMSSERIILNKFRGIVNGMNVIDLEVQNFDNYLNQEIDPISNKFRGIVNKFRGIVNGELLLNNQIELFDPLSNKFRGIVNGTGLLNQNDFAAYNSIFAVIDFEDGATEEDPDRTLDKLYATNLLTGLDVTEGEGPSLIFPGAFISSISNNFNTIYNSATINVAPANLFVQTPNLAIDYGVGITTEYINSRISPVPVEGCEVCPETSLFFDGFVYNETVETVFGDPNCLPEEEICSIVIAYYFEDVNTFEQYFIDDADEVGLILPVGSYYIKISDPQNYTLDFGEAIGELTVTNKELIVSGNNDGEPYEIVYGETISSEVLDAIVVISGLDEGEIGNVFPDGTIPYFLEEKLENPEQEANTFELGDPISTGDYYVRINMPESNYEISYENPLIVRVTKKELIFNADSFERAYGEEITDEDIEKFNNPTESLVPVIQGFAYDDDGGDLFDGVIPYVFVPFEGDSEIPLGGQLNVGIYNIRIAGDALEALQNYTIFYEDEEDNNTLEITKATLNACIDDVEIRDGDFLTPGMIESTITGILVDPPYNDSLGTIFPPDGIPTYLVEVNGKQYEVTENGLLRDGELLEELPLGTYTITIKDDDIINYMVVPGTTCSGIGSVVVTDCGDAVILDFSNYTYDELFGYYRFSDVALGSGFDLDALVTVQTRGDVQDFIIDQNSFPAGSEDRRQFRPTASFNITSAFPEPYVEFSITLVNAGTNTPATEVEKLIAGVLDVDGQPNYQEYVEVNLPLEYTIDGATQIQVIENPDQGLLRINGHNSSYTATFNGEPRVNVEVVYENVSSLIYRVGARGNAGNGPSRQYGIQFACLTNFNSPVKTTVIEFGSLMAATAPENECVVYNNPVGPVNGYDLILLPKEGVSGAASVTFTKIGSIQSVTFNEDDLGFASEEEPITINMGPFEPGLYVVQTSIGDCQSDAFIVIRKE